MDDLQRLIDAVKIGAAAADSFYDVFADGAKYGPSVAYYASRAYDGSLDAAEALHDDLLPGWVVERLSMWPGKASVRLFGTHEYNGERWHSFEDGRHEAEADNPARAWLLAILRAWKEVRLARSPA